MPICQVVFTLVTRGSFLTSASNFNIEPNGEIFDVSPENDRASPNMKTGLRPDDAKFALEIPCGCPEKHVCVHVCLNSVSQRATRPV